MNVIPGQGCLPFGSRTGTPVESTISRSRIERCFESSFELRQFPDLGVDSMVSRAGETKGTTVPTTFGDST